MKAPRTASFGGHEKPALELLHFERRVVGCCHHALALTPRYGHDQSRTLSLQRLSPPSSLLWAPRTPSRHDRISPSAYTHRLRPTWAAEEGLPSFRIRLSLRAGFHTPEASCPPPAHRGSLLPSPRSDGLGHFPFRVLLSRGCKVHALAFGPQVCFPRARPYGLGRAFDAPHRRRHLGRHPEPATRRSGAYRGGTYTRKSDTASNSGRPDPPSFRTLHLGSIPAAFAPAALPRGRAVRVARARYFRISARPSSRSCPRTSACPRAG